MPRSRRLIPVDSALHITARGNNRQNIFNQDEDKSYYRYLLKNLKDENNISIFHYCIMTNHIHLIVWVKPESTLSRFIKQLNLSYFVYFKRTYSYCGHLWQGRFKSNIIDTDSYLLQCGKYIELNPVRAQIVDLPGPYSFSSYRFYAYGTPDPLVTASPAYLALSSQPEERRKSYIKFVVDSSIINADTFTRLQFIGSEFFTQRLHDYYGIRNENRKRGRPKKAGK